MQIVKSISLLLVPVAMSACSVEPTPSSSNTLSGERKTLQESPNSTEDMDLALYSLATTPAGVPAPNYAVASVSGTLAATSGCLMLDRADGS
jgi:hypothetical protein